MTQGAWIILTPHFLTSGPGPVVPQRASDYARTALVELSGARTGRWSPEAIQGNGKAYAFVVIYGATIVLGILL